MPAYTRFSDRAFATLAAAVVASILGHARLTAALAGGCAALEPAVAAGLKGFLGDGDAWCLPTVFVRPHLPLSRPQANPAC